MYANLKEAHAAVVAKAQKAMEREQFIYRFVNMLVTEDLILPQHDKFLRSIHNWMRVRGYLSEAQLNSVERMINTYYDDLVKYVTANSTDITKVA